MNATINGKTPEEIRKGLECCNTIYGCKQCPYDVGGEDLHCCVKRNADALALINQLERERDAAVEDLETMGEDRAYCDTCLHNNTNPKEEPCSSCMSGYLINNWQWRGVQEVE